MNAEIETQILSQIAALRSLVALLLADRFDEDILPAKASERFLKILFSAGKPVSMPDDLWVAVSEQIALIVDHAAQIAMKRDH